MGSRHNRLRRLLAKPPTSPGCGGGVLGRNTRDRTAEVPTGNTPALRMNRPTFETRTAFPVVHPVDAGRLRRSRGTDGSSHHRHAPRPAAARTAGPTKERFGWRHRRRARPAGRGHRPPTGGCAGTSAPLRRRPPAASGAPRRAYRCGECRCGDRHGNESAASRRPYYPSRPQPRHSAGTAASPPPPSSLPLRGDGGVAHAAFAASSHGSGRWWGPDVNRRPRGLAAPCAATALLYPAGVTALAIADGHVACTRARPPGEPGGRVSRGGKREGSGREAACRLPGRPPGGAKWRPWRQCSGPG